MEEGDAVPQVQDNVPVHITEASFCTCFFSGHCLPVLDNPSHIYYKDVLLFFNIATSRKEKM